MLREAFRTGAIAAMLVAASLALPASPSLASGIETLLMPGKVSRAHEKQEEQCALCHDRSDKTRQAALVVYDQVITRPGRAEDPPGTERRMRLALLRANDDFVGVIGLLEYTAPRFPDAPNDAKRPGIGGVILVINASDLARRSRQSRRLPGVRVASEPTLTEYPSPDGKGTIPVRVSAVWDPDGYFVELNQLLGTAAGTEQR